MSSLLRIGIAGCLFLVGCTDRTPSGPSPASNASAPVVSVVASSSFQARALATQQPRGAVSSGAVRPRKLPAPVAMPSGGSRIEMRGVPVANVRTLERQPDGSYKQTCRNPAEILGGGSAR